MPKNYTIDATGKAFGRLATEIAVILRGKNKPDFAPNKIGDCIVKIENVDKIKITGKKLKQKIYYRHSGYPGGFRQPYMQEVIEKKGKAEVLKKAVYGMLPKNRLRARMIKNLKIS